MEMFIRDLQPSQFYLSEKKIVACREWMQRLGVEDKFSPLPIKQIGHRIFLTDGHTRAYLAYQAGWERVPVIWDEDELDWEAYLICVQTAEAKGIHTEADLATRILSEEEYQEKWLNWCQEIFHANQPNQKNP